MEVVAAIFCLNKSAFKLPSPNSRNKSDVCKKNHFFIFRFFLHFLNMWHTLTTIVVEGVVVDVQDERGGHVEELILWSQLPSWEGGGWSPPSPTLADIIDFSYFAPPGAKVLSLAQKWENSLLPSCVVSTLYSLQVICFPPQNE